MFVNYFILCCFFAYFILFLANRQNIEDSKFWRLSAVNEMLDVCVSYPTVLAVPKCIQDAQLRKAASQRASGRIPVLTWLHPNGAPLCRASQPLTGIRDTFGQEDDLLLLAMQKSVSISQIHEGESMHSLSPTASRTDGAVFSTKEGFDCTLNLQAAEDDDNMDDPWMDIMVEIAAPNANASASAHSGLTGNRSENDVKSNSANVSRSSSSSSTHMLTRNAVSLPAMVPLSLTESITLATSAALVDPTQPPAPPLTGTRSNAGDADSSEVKSPGESISASKLFLRIVDCRDLLSAQGNVIMGKGFENVSRIGNFVSIQFEGIGNIHTMRESYRSLRVAYWKASVSMIEAGLYDMEVPCMWDAAVPSARSLQSPATTGGAFMQAVIDSKWLHHLSDVRVVCFPFFYCCCY